MAATTPKDTDQAVAAVRPASVEEAARPQNKDYVPRFEDGTEKPFEKWSTLEQEMYEANQMSPEAVRLSTSHLGPTAKVGLDPRGPLVAPEHLPEGSPGAYGSSDLSVPTGAPGKEKMEKQNADAEAEIMANAPSTSSSPPSASAPRKTAATAPTTSTRRTSSE